MAVQGSHFFRLPREIRNGVYDMLLDHEQPAVLVHPTLLDQVVAGGKSTRSGRQNKKIAITAEGSRYPLVCRQFRSEYLEELAKLAYDLDVRAVYVCVADFQLDVALDNFLERLVNSGYDPNGNPKAAHIEVLFHFTTNFAEHRIDLNQVGVNGFDTSLGRWLVTRDQSHTQGRRIPIALNARRFDLLDQSPIQTFLNLYRICIYRSRQSVELDDVVAEFGRHFGRMHDLRHLTGAEDPEDLETSTDGEDDSTDSEDDSTDGEDDKSKEANGPQGSGFAVLGDDEDSDDEPDDLSYVPESDEMDEADEAEPKIEHADEDMDDGTE